MREKPLTKVQIVQKLLDGWQLGHSHTIDGRAWMQRDLGCGGESHQCHMSSFVSLLKENAIVQLPKRKGDAWYLTRYGLPDSGGGQHG